MSRILALLALAVAIEVFLIGCDMTITHVVDGETVHIIEQTPLEIVPSGDFVASWNEIIFQ